MKLPNALAPERSYYWRARAQDGANTGPYSSAAFFNVFTPVVLAKPILQEPVANATAATLQPVFRFANAPRSGPAGPITYEIQLADNEAFANVVGFWTVGEAAGQTSLPCPVALTSAKQYFWRVRGLEATTTGPWSEVAAFKAPASRWRRWRRWWWSRAPAMCPPGPATAQRAEQVVLGVGTEFPSMLLGVGRPRRPALQRTLLRMIWHLRFAGFQASRQQKSLG